MKYSVIVPTYNHCEDFLKPCIESILKYTNMAEVELIISANGCTDNTLQYLTSLQNQFNSLGFDENLKIVWSDSPLGYAKATNAGILSSTTDKIILLNNDTVLLEQRKSLWLELFMQAFTDNPKCGISAPLLSYSEAAGHHFAIFFAVMIDRKVFDVIGLLNEEYGIGSGEDIEFCIEAERAGFEIVECTEKHWDKNTLTNTGTFPIYHKGEGTVHDTSLVKGWDDIFYRNSLTLAKKYNREWYKKELHKNGMQV